MSRASRIAGILAVLVVKKLLAGQPLLVVGAAASGGSVPLAEAAVNQTSSGNLSGVFGVERSDVMALVTASMSYDNGNDIGMDPWESRWLNFVAEAVLYEARVASELGERFDFTLVSGKEAGGSLTRDDRGVVSNKKFVMGKAAGQSGLHKIYTTVEEFEKFLEHQHACQEFAGMAGFQFEYQLQSWRSLPSPDKKKSASIVPIKIKTLTFDSSMPPADPGMSPTNTPLETPAARRHAGKNNTKHISTRSHADSDSEASSDGSSSGYGSGSWSSNSFSEPTSSERSSAGDLGISVADGGDGGITTIDQGVEKPKRKDISALLGLPKTIRKGPVNNQLVGLISGELLDKKSSVWQWAPRSCLAKFPWTNRPTKLKASKRFSIKGSLSAERTTIKRLLKSYLARTRKEHWVVNGMNAARGAVVGNIPERGPRIYATRTLEGSVVAAISNPTDYAYKSLVVTIEQDPFKSWRIDLAPGAQVALPIFHIEGEVDLFCTSLAMSSGYLLRTPLKLKIPSHEGSRVVPPLLYSRPGHSTLHFDPAPWAKLDTR